MSEIPTGAYQLVGAGKPDWVSHDIDGRYYIARQYLQVSGVPLETINRLYDQDGVWHYSFPDINPYNLSVDELLELSDEVMPPIWTAGHLSASHGVHPLMNLHTWYQHGRKVADHALNFVRQAGYGEQVQIRTILATQAHDMPNTLSREEHHLHGGKMLSRVFPQLLSDPRQFAIIENAAKLHNGASDKLVSNVQTTAEKLAIYKEIDTPESLALRMADKVDTGRWRSALSALELTRDFMDIDQEQRLHALSNMLWSTTNVGLENGKFVWHVQFTPTLTQEEVEIYRPRITTRNNGIYVPKHLRTDPTDSESLCAFDAAKKEIFDKVYAKRVRRAMDAALLLFEGQVSVGSLVLHDTNGEAVEFEYS